MPLLRKSFRVVLLALFLGPLASCRRGADPAGALSAAAGASSAGKVIVIAHAQTEGRSRELMDAMERDFEARHAGVDVRQIVMADDDYEKFGLLNLFSSDVSPDLFFQWSGYLVERDARVGFSMELSTFLERDRFRENFYPEVWIGTDWEGKTHLLPHRLNISVAIFYNRDLFDRLSLRPPADWPAFEALCDRLRAAGIAPIVAGNKDLWMVGNWAGHLASRIAGEEEYHAAFSLRREHRFDAPGWREALELIAGLARRRAFNPGAVSMTEDEAKADFLAGRAAMIPDGDWLNLDLAKLASEGRTFRYGFFNTPPIPGGRGSQGSVMGVCTGFSIGRKSRDPELSWQFLKEFFQPERQKTWVAEGAMSPVAGTRQAVEIPALRDMIQLLKEAPKVVSPPDTGYAPAGWMAFFDAVQQVLAGNRSPEEALREAERYVAVFEPRR
ncbi:MAG: extracellular solute-binding protein [Planctomycetes bacterium]|nr:extracellular solute-binding protein [Planctomycetota bacterium]